MSTVPKTADQFLADFRSALLLELGIAEGFDWTADRAISSIFVAFSRVLEPLSSAIAAAGELSYRKATGSKLLEFAEYAHVPIDYGEKSKCLVRLTNSKSVAQVARAGVRVRSGEAPDVVYWKILEDVVIPASSYVDTYVASEDVGAFYVSIGAINKLIDASGYTVSNTATPLLGYSADTEDSIRAKIGQNELFAGLGNPAAIQAMIQAAPGVLGARVLSNSSLDPKTYSTITVPGGHFAIAVYPPVLTTLELDNIVEIIYGMMPPATGIAVPADSTEGALYTEYGSDKGKMDIGVLWAVKRTIKIEVTVTKFDAKPSGQMYKLDELKLPIETAIGAYIASLNKGNPLGNDIILQRVLSRCVSIDGCASCTIRASVNGGSYSASDVVVSDLEYVELSEVVFP